MSVFYGPVLSKRFGFSLGVDIVEWKHCTYDCIYCQLGKTTHKTMKRRNFVIEGLKHFPIKPFTKDKRVS
jgi:wyosine [tRNA(Phe)-imidazoG37] synthetase (radical SAM superfamily)